jgi:CRISPR-associated protein Cst2
MKIRKINVCADMVLENHNVNANIEGDNKKVDGHTAIAGQKIKHMLFESIKILDGSVHISNSDGVMGNIELDLRSDFGGYMITQDKANTNKRLSPIKVSYAIARNVSKFSEDLFVRFKMNLNEADKDAKKHSEQRINTKNYSVKDEISLNYQMDCGELSTSQFFEYDKTKHLKTIFYKHVDEVERKKRARLFIESTSKIEGFANESRNAVVNAPTKVFISFADDLEFIKYFDMTEMEQKNLKRKLDSCGVTYFIGDNNSEYSVHDAYTDALKKFDELEMIDLSNDTIKTQKEIEDMYV